MADTSPIPVRLNKTTIDRLDAVSKKIGSNRAALMRMLVEQWLNHYEKEGRAILPVDFEDIMKNLDGRTHRYSETPVEIPPALVAEPTPKKKGKVKS